MGRRESQTSKIRSDDEATLAMRILVTGGAGYIGSHTLRVLLAAGHEAWAYDHCRVGHAQAVPPGRLIRGDLADVEHLDQALLQYRIEAVLHFAADAMVGESVTMPAKYYQNNFVNTFHLVERCRRQGIQRFVFSSTCATYGVPEVVPIPETTPQRPINPYGRSKLMVEQLLADYATAYGLGYTNLRYFNASGAAADGTLGEDHTPETHLIPLVLQVALGQREAISIFGTDYPTPDGTCIRDYIHVEDLAVAHQLALEQLVPGQGNSFNVGTGRGYSVREVIRLAETVTGRPIPVRESPRRPGDPPILVASAEAIQNALGWRPRYTELRPILETAWRWHQAHPKGYTQA